MKFELPFEDFWFSVQRMLDCQDIDYILQNLNK